MFVMLNSQGEEVGKYEGSPAVVARKVSREVYKKTGQKNFRFVIMNKKTHHQYRYEANIKVLRNPEPVSIGNSTFYKRYDIELVRH